MKVGGRDLRCGFVKLSKRLLIIIVNYASYCDMCLVQVLGIVIIPQKVKVTVCRVNKQLLAANWTQASRV